MKIPSYVNMTSDAYDQLVAVTAWYEAMPKDVAGLNVGVLAGNRFHENIFECKQEIFEECEHDDMEDVYIADAEIVDGQLYALFQDDDNKWEKCEKVIITRIPNKKGN